MKHIIDYITEAQEKSDWTKFALFPELSDAANLDCLLYLLDEFYGEYTNGDVNRVIRKIGDKRIPFYDANTDMVEFLYSVIQDWIEEKEDDWKDNKEFKKDYVALKKVKDDSFDEDDFIFSIPTKQEYEKYIKSIGR